MPATAELTTALQKQVLLLEDDLRARVDDDPEIRSRWSAEHQTAVQRGRTAAAWEPWRDERVTQAAVGWVLTTVFVRFCEDNGLVRAVWIAGPERRRQETLDAQLDYFRQHPEHTDREWIEQPIAYFAALPATAALVDSHAAIHLVAPSGDAASALLAFWRTRSEDGRLVHDFTDPQLSTRFLGDLYQDLSQHAKDTYALLQTPEFVEEFILDQTLEPALRERPLDGFRAIDPACGSGHFLLGTFRRLLDRWHREAPGMEPQARVQKALDSIHGVDLNPFAVAIARFRLTVAAMQAVGLRNLEEAPSFAYHLAVGDSLLHGHTQLEFDLGSEYDTDAALSSFTYGTENLDLLRELLQPRRYDAVTANPPYITVRDKALNQAYRERYKSCKGTYALTVPFMERLFQLAKTGDTAGWVGQITSNSFMKREFGSKLIEDFLVRQDLRLVADTSGAYIPGHGTPTVIIVGRPAAPVATTVRAVLGVRGEQDVPDVPAEGKVWSSIVKHWNDPGWSDAWVSVADLPRSFFACHPWSLNGGAAAEVRQRLEAGSRRTLGSAVADIGFGAVTREDDAYLVGTATLRRRRIDERHRRPLVEGQAIRDWFIATRDEALWPYDPQSLEASLDIPGRRFLWPVRTMLADRVAYGESQTERGLAWFEYSMFFRRRFGGEQVLVVPTVATHVHVGLDRHRRVFKDSVIVVRLADGALDNDYLGLLGLMNSSSACFWLKQVCQDKGNRGGERSTARFPWEHYFAFNGKNVGEVPMPQQLPFRRGAALQQLSEDVADLLPVTTVGSAAGELRRLDDARIEYESLLRRMVAEQEELDWEVYRLYGLVEEDLTYDADDLPEVGLGERAFEIALARRMAAGHDEAAWFARHRSTPITDIPRHWPSAYRAVVQRRLDLIDGDPVFSLLEAPEFKRRWATVPWEKQQEQALRDWLLDRLETPHYWLDTQGRPTPKSVAQLADDVARDADLVGLLALWEGRPDVPVGKSLVRLLADESVPYLAAYRYKESGLRKRAAWERTWELQRADDRGEQVRSIPVPPRYSIADFVKGSYWQARGKLDVPKERFILYTNAGRDADPTPLLGWAGWDHAQQALALSLIIGAREADGWPDERLVPLVAGLAEVQPWVDQWHADVDPTYGVSLAAFTREQLTSRAAQVGKTLDELAAWRPTTPARGRKPRP